ncbi:MAG: hypothetical protein IPI46_10195 [Bacteroidetes bacterium]|nr:hypothetical protein [Bacteroidota bacterium]
MKQKLLRLLVLIGLYANSSLAQNLSVYEYWYDANYASRIITGIGNPNHFNLDTALNLQTFPGGLHTIHIRFKDDSGRWSMPLSREYFNGKVTQYEYWYDENYTARITTNISNGGAEHISLSSIPLQAFPLGMHNVHFRFKNGANRWSPAITKTIYKGKQITEFQYWFDGQFQTASTSILPSADSIIHFNSMIQANGLQDGLHTLYYRFKSNGGIWTVVNKSFVTVKGNAITEFQYWFNDDFAGAVNIPQPSTSHAHLDSVISCASLNDTMHFYHFRTKNEKGKWSLTTTDSFMRPPPVPWYQDADADSFGNAAVVQMSRNQPLGYVLDSTDCNDTNALEFPGQVWYVDNDGDGYGIGEDSVDCFRPLNYYAASELDSLDGDCNDLDSLISPGSTYFTFSSGLPFSNSLVWPQSGGIGTSFQFEVMYFDMNNVMPPPSYPRLMLDFEGNEIYTDPQDRIFIMMPADISDTIIADGKKYVATVNALPPNVNWTTKVLSQQNLCTIQTPILNYPDVLIASDLEIYANDITFSQSNPGVSTQQVVSATIHNESDYPAQNFIVHLQNMNDTLSTFSNITVPYLSPNGVITVSWTITTPSLPMWCPMKVSVDYSNVIIETNELDNSAIRAFVNGNFNLSGAIAVIANVSPSVAVVGSSNITLNGHADYQGTSAYLPNTFVAGANVYFTVLETGASYTSTTDANGNFVVAIPQPASSGIYHIQGYVTDFTTQGNFNTSFEVINYLGTNTSGGGGSSGGGSGGGGSTGNVGCTGPDLSLWVYPTRITKVVGDSIHGSVLVFNGGNLPSDSSILIVKAFDPNLSQTTLISMSIPPLLPGAQFTVAYNLLNLQLGFYSIMAQIDVDEDVVECIEWNNGSWNTIHVVPNATDIVAGWTLLPTTVNQCEVSNVEFYIINTGGLSSGSFECLVTIKRDGIVVGSVAEQISNVPSIIDFPDNMYNFNIAFNPLLPGNYTFELICDNNSVIAESVESNNEGSYEFEVTPCKPNISFVSCNATVINTLNGNYLPGSSAQIQTQIINSGSFGYTGPLTLAYHFSDNTIQYATQNVNLPAGSSPFVFNSTITIPIGSMPFVTTLIDELNLIDEADETDNVQTDNICPSFQAIEPCGSNLWSNVYQPFQSIFPVAGVSVNSSFKANSIKVNFKVSGPGIIGNLNLGDAYLTNALENCYCPYPVTCPVNYYFNQTGVYEFTITVDPDNQYSECDETDNVMIKSVQVSDLPDLRILSQYIAPSTLNPQPGQPMSLVVSYENIGSSNLNDTTSVHVFIDDSLFAKISSVNGLMSGADTTIIVPGNYFTNVVGMHIIKAQIDSSNLISENNELNNIATRSFIVGESANMHFKELRTLNPSPPINQMVEIKGRIGNSGDLDCEADVELYYVNDYMDTIYINTVHVFVPANDSVNMSVPWFVVDNKTTIIGKIVNASIVEYRYDDNITSFNIGSMTLVFSNTPACGVLGQGTLSANILGGTPPYTYYWANGYVGQTYSGTPGMYTVLVNDATGQSISGVGEIIACPPVTLNLKMLFQGYYTGSQQMTPAIFNEGVSNTLPTHVDTVQIKLIDSVNLQLVESFKGVVNINGALAAYFSPNVNGTAFYVCVSHRSSIETWSSYPVLLTTNTFYDFTSSDSQAYGANLLQMASGIWAIYTGDVNQDENIDLLDMSQLDADIASFQYGYYATDLNGDGNVDLLDQPLLDVNVNNFIFANHP